MTDDVTEEQRERAARGRLALLAAVPGREKYRVEPSPSGNRLLDVQCDGGIGARVATEAGWDVTSVSALDDALALDGQFDVVIVTHPQADDAPATLDALRSGARPGGWLLVEAPHRRRAIRRRGGSTIDGRRSDHVTPTTRATLATTLATAGWEPVWVGTRTWRAADGLTRIRDAAGLGDVVVAVARRPISPARDRG